MNAQQRTIRFSRTTMTAATLAALTIFTGTITTASACDNCESLYRPGTYTGAVQRLGNGVVYSWVTLNEKGKPSAIGVTISETALEGLPEKSVVGKVEMPWHGFTLALPKEAMKTAFDHIGFDWNPKGHEPNGVYNIPHFDLHFYMISEAERMKITAQGSDIAKCQKPVPAAFVPQGFIYAKGTEVPMMGGHWVNPKAPELSGQPFTKTFLYGSYNGKMIHYEPMLTKAWLESKPDFTETFGVATTYAKSGFYPTKYSVRYDVARKEYNIVLEGMVWREGAEKTTAPAKVAQKPAVKPSAKK
jgi:hypothetical protein